MQIKDPINYFLRHYPFDIDMIKSVVCGKKYCAVELTDGKTGVCATLLNKLRFQLKDWKKLDPENISHRIVLNAWINARISGSHYTLKQLDVFEAVNFQKYKNLVMIGFFKPLVHKMNLVGIKPAIFDKLYHSSPVKPDRLQKKAIANADGLILTATTIFNKSFQEIIQQVNPDCEVHVLGPSSIIHPDLFQIPQISTISGVYFPGNPSTVLEIIENGGGTRDFLPFSEKRVLFR